MSNLLKYNVLAYVEDNTDTSDPVRAKIKSLDTTTGYTLSYYEKCGFQIAAGAGPIALTPPAFPALANDNLEYIMTVTYGGAVALADQFITVNIDAVGASSVRKWGAGTIGTSLTATNPGAAAVTVEIIWFIRTT